MSDSPEKSGGLFASLRQLAATGIAIFQTRLALAGIELEEEIQRLLKVLLLSLGLILFLALGLLVFTLMIVLAFRDEHRVLAMGVLAFAYLAIAAGLWWQLRARLADRPPIFEATLAEFEKDRAALKVAVLDDEASSLNSRKEAS